MTFDYSVDFESIDFRKQPELYRCEKWQRAKADRRYVELKRQHLEGYEKPMRAAGQ